MTTSHTNPQPVPLYWSCTPAPAGMRMAWSARGIYKPGKCTEWKDDERVPAKVGDGEALEFLPDRQAFVGPDGVSFPNPALTEFEDKKDEARPILDFANCIDEVIIPALLEEMLVVRLEGNSYNKIELRGQSSYPWTLVATPNGSHGYMYVSVWLMPKGETMDTSKPDEGLGPDDV